MYACIFINTICTLKCKKCITGTPYQSKQYNFRLEDIKGDMDTLFAVFNRKHYDHIDFEGGETLLHPDLPQIISHGLKFIGDGGGQGDELRILTNCTLLPNKDLLDVCKTDKVMFLLDDYGPELSTKKDEIVELLKKENIRYMIRTYYGDNLYFDWVDFGNMSFLNETQEQVYDKYKVCKSTENEHMKNGRVYACTVQCMEPAGIPFNEGDYIDLRCGSDIEEMRKSAKKYLHKKAVNHCYYCSLGYIRDGGGNRITPAEQLDIVTPEMRTYGLM